MKCLYMMLIFGLVIFSGCTATDKVYGTAKTVYKTGKEVYKVVPVKSKTLEAAAAGAEKYDSVRTIIREP